MSGHDSYLSAVRRSFCTVMGEHPSFAAALRTLSVALHLRYLDGRSLSRMSDVLSGAGDAELDPEPRFHTTSPRMPNRREQLLGTRNLLVRAFILSRAHFTARMPRQFLQQRRVSTIVLLSAGFDCSDSRGITGVARNSEVFHQPPTPSHRSGRFSTDDQRRRQTTRRSRASSNPSCGNILSTTISPVLRSDIAIVCGAACKSQSNVRMILETTRRAPRRVVPYSPVGSSSRITNPSSSISPESTKP
jgi:hypothetical protein